MPFSMSYKLEPRPLPDFYLTQKQRLSLHVLATPQAKLEEMIRVAEQENPFIEIERWNTYVNQHRRSDFAVSFSNEDDPFWEAQQSLTRKPSLIEHLTRQLCELRLTREELTLGEHIIGNLDGNGYLAVPLEELASQTDLPLPIAEAVLQRIQNFDPVGVAARSARECLLVQLKQRGEGDSLAARIVDGYLRELAAKRYDEIAQKLSAEVVDVECAHKRIVSLEPKPAREFDCEHVRVAIPEVVVERIEDEWRVSLADTGLPRLRVNKSRYRWLIKRLSPDQKLLKDDFRKQFQEARDLLQAVRDRHKTLLSAATEMFKRQAAFLDYGRCAVQPMMMKEVAAEIKVCESTVSRAVADRFARTPHGIFPLKFFFQDSVARTDPDDVPVSSEYVKNTIRDLIASEDWRKPLTDDEIVRRLSADHKIKMARRTVNKYRDVLNIRPANQRRREAEAISG